jgi:hypothetical protein
MGQRLSADDLGQTGEDLFARLCSQSGLTCNKSLRDRAGWDFTVDIPATGDGAVSLDQRTAMACSVQLKSTTNSNPARLSLSAIERVAKDPRPAFVVIFRLTPDGREVAGYLIHLIGPVLERVLRRLRHAEATGRVDIHKATISLEYQRLGVRFDLTAVGLRAAIELACGSDMASYVSEKQRQLDELGYDDGRLLAEAAVWIENPDHFGRMLIGLEPLKPVQLRAFDVRFGIAIPYKGSAFDDVEELRIEPPSVGTCQIAVRGPPLTQAAVFVAEAFVGPPIPIEDHPWLLVRHRDFTMTFAGQSVRFETEGDFYGQARTLAEWRPLTRALVCIASGTGVVSFQFAGDLQKRLTLPMTEPLQGPQTESLPQLIHFIEAWSQLTQMAGVAAVQPFSLEDLWAAKGVQIAADLMTNPSSPASFAFDSEAFEASSNGADALYFNSCRLADAALSFCVRVTLQRIGDEYRSVAFSPIEARPEVDDLLGYGQDQATASGITILINPDNLVEVSLDALTSVEVPTSAAPLTGEASRSAGPDHKIGDHDG